MIPILLIKELKSSYREVWMITVMLTWWHIWKVRNVLIFQGTKVGQGMALSWIKAEALSNCINYNLIDANLANLWLIDPGAALDYFANSNKVQFFIKLSSGYEKIGFSDGAWRISSQKGGMGGIIRSKMNNIVYACSGPVHALSALEAELAACMYIWHILGEQERIQRVALCVDSLTIVDMFEKAKAGSSDDRFGFDSIKDLIKSYPNVSLFFIKRSWNLEADELAKKGLSRSFLVQGWL